ncbi:hypothetical protein [Bacillus wiedmannii]|uniref:hypothetical protein n=1 Tax=Bacillus wiedmannii TaxID=1890302 RepID=UPI003D9603D9
MKNQFYQISIEEEGDIGMHLVSKYANILFEIKCDTSINDTFCHEMEISLDDSESIYTEVNLLTLMVFIGEYENTSKKSNRKHKKYHPIINNVKSYIPENISNLKELEYNITMEREELEQFIIHFGNTLKK